MTVSPDFGGREIEEGLAEDLGAPPPEHTVDHEDKAGSEWTTTRRMPRAWSARCAARSSRAGQDVRRRVGGEWVHDVCPVV